MRAFQRRGEVMANVNRTNYRMPTAHRDKIANSNILNNLIEHAEGTKELTSSQVQAGIALLKKVLPDLQSVALTDASHTGPAKIVIGWDD